MGFEPGSSNDNLLEFDHDALRPSATKAGDFSPYMEIINCFRDFLAVYQMLAAPGVSFIKKKFGRQGFLICIDSMHSLQISPI